MVKLFVVMIMVGLAIISNPVSAADPDMLQDVCVADLTSDVKVNGFPCKKNFTASDFFTDILGRRGQTDNIYLSNVTLANVFQVPGLNTLGTSMARIDFAPGGLNPPHTHPRATEMIFVLHGKLFVGFITTANIFVPKTVRTGEVYTFPRGLVHFQKNIGRSDASVLAAFNSQNPGTQSIALTLFTSTPPVPDIVLAQAFQISIEEVQAIRRRLTPKELE